MGSDALSRRDPWQYISAIRGQEAERAFNTIMTMYLEKSDIIAIYKPKTLRDIYGTRTSGRPHGIEPDCQIQNSITERGIFVEIKRQKADGNAHERACKFMMPGMLTSIRKATHQNENVIPFWWVFTEGIASDLNYRQEILHWFQGIEGHVLLWENIENYEAVIKHFEEHIRPLIT